MKRHFSLLWLVLFFFSGSGSPIWAQPAVTSTPHTNFPFIAEVSTNELNVRAGQSENFEKIALLKRGDEVVVLGQSYGWYKIVLPAQSKIYVSKDYVKMVGKDLGEISGNRVNVRGGPGTNFSVIIQLKQGDVVRVLEEKDGWYRIEPPDQANGWIAAQYVQFKSSTVSPPNLQESLKAEVAQLKSVLASSEPVLAENVPGSLEKAASFMSVIASGLVDDLGPEAISQEVRHQLVYDGKVLYLLKGYRMVLDGFLHQKVNIEGQIQKDMKSGVPVVLVTKIKLVL